MSLYLDLCLCIPILSKSLKLSYRLKRWKYMLPKQNRWDMTHECGRDILCYIFKGTVVYCENYFLKHNYVTVTKTPHTCPECICYVHSDFEIISHCPLFCAKILQFLNNYAENIQCNFFINESLKTDWRTKLHTNSIILCVLSYNLFDCRLY